jgi:hypothetical protein
MSHVAAFSLCPGRGLAYNTTATPMSTEAGTRRKFVVPRLQNAGWDSDPHSIAEQRSFTDGRIIVRGNRAERKKTKRAEIEPLARMVHDLKFVGKWFDEATQQERPLYSIFYVDDLRPKHERTATPEG